MSIYSGKKSARICHTLLFIRFTLPPHNHWCYMKTQSTQRRRGIPKRRQRPTDLITHYTRHTFAFALFFHTNSIAQSHPIPTAAANKRTHTLVLQTYYYLRQVSLQERTCTYTDVEFTLTPQLITHSLCLHYYHQPASYMIIIFAPSQDVPPPLPCHYLLST